jgi:SAM-dependent methyltransferase
MSSSPLFALGLHEVSLAAEAVLTSVNLDPNTFFARHERGDWGETPEWLRNDNKNAAHREGHSHAIRSHYWLDDRRELLIITAADRSRTRLMLAEEFTSCEVSVQEGYAVWANAYDNPNPLIAVEEPVIDALLATLPPVASAIDVGTGTGRLAFKLAGRGVSEVLGVDATPEMLAVARARVEREGLQNVRFERAVIGEEPLPAVSDTFDLLTCGLMLTHAPDLRSAIRECVRVVRPGGWLLLTDFHPATATFGWRTDFIVPEGRLLMPNTPNTRADYLDALVEAGCTLLDIQDIALDGTPYGDVSEAVVKANGLPPLCLVLFAQKQDNA